MAGEDESVEPKEEQPFATRMFGYDKEEVDLYITRLFDELDSLTAEVEELKRNSSGDPEEVLGKEVEGLLRQAREIASSVTGDAETRASEALAAAEADAKQTREDAERDATELRDQAKAEANRTVAAAQRRLESMKQAEQELSRRLEQALGATKVVLEEMDREQPASHHDPKAWSERPVSAGRETGDDVTQPIDLGERQRRPEPPSLRRSGADEDDPV